MLSSLPSSLYHHRHQIMRNSNPRDPFTYPYLPALSTPNGRFYATESPLRCFARQPTASEDAAGLGDTRSHQVSGLDNIEVSVGMFSNLTPHSPYTMDSREISPQAREERFIQPEESVLPSAAATEQALRDFIKIPLSRPLDLSSLKDITNPAKIPNLTHLAALAIWASPAKRLTLSEIYDAVEDRYPILRDNPKKKWKESLRHRLSLKAVFVRVGNSEKGRRGGYWALDVSKGLNENKRPRKQRSGGSTAIASLAAEGQTPSLSDRDDQGTSDYSDLSYHSSASLSPPAPNNLSGSPMLNYLNYQLSEANISAHHGSPTSGSPDVAQSSYSSENLLLHGAGPLGYSPAQGSASYYSAGHAGLDYEPHHSPALPSLSVSQHFFSTDATDTELHDMGVQPSSSSNTDTYHSQHGSPDYDESHDF